MVVVLKVFLARSRQSGATKTTVWSARLYRKAVRVGFWWMMVPGSLRRALVGDLIAELARSNGWSGIVVHGAIRDSVAIGNLQIGLKTLGTNPRKSTKTGSGFQNLPLQFGNICLTPNHWIYCDSDGIAVSPTNLLAWHITLHPDLFWSNDLPTLESSLNKG